MKSNIRIVLKIILLLVLIYPLKSQYWEKVNLPIGYSSNYWLDVYFLPGDPNYGWACGFNGMVIRTTDGGNTWAGSTIAGAYHLESVHFPTRTVGYTSGVDGIFKSTNGGVTWFDIRPADAGAGMFFWGCYFVDELNGILVGDGCVTDQHFWKTTDGGNTWTLFSGTEPESGMTDVILYEANGRGFAVSSGRIWNTTDGGATWQVYANSGTKVWQEEITHLGTSFLVPYAGTTCQGGGNDGGMRFSTNLGNNWTQFRVGTPMFGTFLIDGRTGWACGYNQAVYYTSDAGATWELRNCGIDRGNLDDLWFINANNGWVVGEGVYKLSPSTQKVSKSSINFGEFCIGSPKYDTIWVKNLSFRSASGTWSLGGANPGDFRIIEPSQNFIMNSCDSQRVIVVFNPTQGGNSSANLEIITEGTRQFNITLTGNAMRATAVPSDTLIVINRAICGQTYEKTIRWTAEVLGERITMIQKVSGTNEFNFSVTLPVLVTTMGVETKFTIRLQDTGWQEARFKVSLFPCDRDTFITIRAYGVSPIISADPTSKEIKLECINKGKLEFEIKNTGNDSLIIKSARIVDIATGFTIAGWKSGKIIPITLQPGEKDTIIINFNPSATGRFATRLRLENNDVTTARGDKNPLELILTGEYGFANMLTKVKNIDFGRICLGDSISVPLSFFKTGNLPLIIDRPSFIKNQFSYTFPATIFPRTLTLLTDTVRGFVNFKPTIRGKLQDTLIITALPCYDTLKIAITGEGIDAGLRLNPAFFDGIFITNQPNQRIVKVTNTGTTDLKITRIYLNPQLSNFSYNFTPNLPVDISPGQTIDFTFNFTPLIDTSFRTNLCFSAEGECPAEQCLLINFQSLSPSLEFDKTAIDFGRQLCNPITKTDKIMITNSGILADTIEVLEIIPDETHFKITNKPQLPYIIKPSEVLDLQIVYFPLTEGIHSGEIIIESKNLQDKSFGIKLNGEFRKTETTPKSFSYDFGRFEKCENDKQINIAYQNSGTLDDTLIISKAGSSNGFITIPDYFLIVEPNNSAELTIVLKPVEFQNDSIYNETFSLYSKVCNYTLNIDVTAELISPKLTLTPTQLNFGSVWKNEASNRTITIQNNSSSRIEIQDIKIIPDNNGFSYQLNLPISLEPSSSVSVPVKFIGNTEGDFNAKLEIIQKTNCLDSFSVDLIARIPQERYSNKVFIGEYTVTPGDKFMIAVSLQDSLPRVNLSKIDYTITFDRWLFYPYKVYLRTNEKPIEIFFDYKSGVLSGFLNEELVKDLFKQSGEFLWIDGIALASDPNLTKLELKQFDIKSDKEVDIEKKDGWLQVTPLCLPNAAIKYTLIPELTIATKNQIITDGHFKADIKATDEMNIYITINDISGNVLYQTTQKVDKNSKELLLDLNNLISGAYFITVKSDYMHIWRDRFNIIR